MADASDVNGYDGDSAEDDAETDNEMNIDGSDDDVLYDTQYPSIDPDICVNPNDRVDHDTTNHNVRMTRRGTVYNNLE